jgi:hypothetical protein
MKTPKLEQMRVAALANIGVWSQVSEITTGRRAPGVLISTGAMYIAHRRGIENLPPLVKECVMLLCLPGSVVIAEQISNPEPCCAPCATGKECGS